MAYIGRQPSYGAFEKQSLTADSSTVTFSLNYTVGSASSIMVSVAGVLQEPDTGYSLSGGGTSIVFSAAPTSGDSVFIIYLGLARDVAQFLNTGIVTGHSALTTGIQGGPILGTLTAEENTLKTIETNIDIILDANGSGITKCNSHLQLNAQGELRLGDADTSAYIGFKAPNDVK